MPHGGATPRGVGASLFDRPRHLFACFIVVSTVALIFVGGLVTTLEAGLSVPDWPLSYGMLMPPMVGNVFFEHGHRMVASLVGFFVLVLAVWTARAETQRGVRRLAWGALAAVVAQGLLGGLTVRLLLPPAISIAHACLAQAFLCIVVALACVTSRGWPSAEAADDTHGIRRVAALCAGLTFAQLFVGAVMRHLGAGLAIPDFPLAQGRLVPVLDSLPVAVHFGHRVLALVVTACVVGLFVLCRRSGDRRFTGFATFALILVVAQLSLGAWTVLSARSVVPTTAHVATGAALLATVWALTLRAFRHLRPAADLATSSSRVATPAGAL